MKSFPPYLPEPPAPVTAPSHSSAWLCRTKGACSDSLRSSNWTCAGSARAAGDPGAIFGVWRGRCLSCFLAHFAPSPLPVCLFLMGPKAFPLARGGSPQTAKSIRVGSGSLNKNQATAPERPQMLRNAMLILPYLHAHNSARRKALQRAMVSMDTLRILYR